MACWYPSPWWPRSNQDKVESITPKKASKPRKKAAKKEEIVLT